MNLKQLYIICLIAASLTACNQGSNIEVRDLRCEYLIDPLGIDTETPRFSWTLTDPTNERCQRQTAYRILVATSPTLLKVGKADVHDSGIVDSAQSPSVVCKGFHPCSGTEYFWKVMVYDNQRKASGWSKPARFSMGLLDRSEWKGDWIKHPSALPRQHVWFRKNCLINDRASSAFVHVASIGYHILYVNGHQADNRMLAPALSRFDVRTLYVTYDVAHLLNEGNNVIAVWYAPGWSNHRSLASAVRQSFLLQLYGETSEGETIEIHSDESWKCSESCGQNSGNFQMGDMGGEGMDGRMYDDRWNAVDFDDRQWHNAVRTSPLSSGKEPILSAQMTDPTRLIETFNAKSVSHTDSGEWKADMGKNFTGFLEMKFNGLGVGDTVRFSISDRRDSMDIFHQDHYYVARGEDGETFRNRFNFFAGRYVYISGLTRRPECSDITGYSITSAAERTAKFECSDTLLNRIYEADQRTYEACTTEGFTSDCPNRERLGYGSESAYQTTWGLGLPCFASAAFYEKNVRDWSDVQRPDGAMYYIAPQAIYTWGGPIYGGANMNVAWEHYLVYGDRKILEEAYPAGKRWLDYLSRRTIDGLLYQYTSDPGCYLGDWLAPGYRMELGNSDKARFFNICVHAFTIDCFIRIARELGYTDVAASYSDTLRSIRTRAHDIFFRPDINSYLNGDQVRTAFALYAGIVPDSLYKAVSEHLEQDLKGEHPYFDIGSPSRYPYFKVLLADRRFHEPVSEILSKTTYPSYGYFIATGETTLPETWESNIVGHREGNTSAHIHTSYVGISAWFIKGLAGIEPDSEAPDGYRTVNIRPIVPRNLTYAKASIVTPFGKVESGWTKTGDNIIYDIVIPIGSAANVRIPATADRITENGLLIEQVKGVAQIAEQDGYLCLKLETGRYQLTVKPNKN
jgi:alpha-L-rhamnosidase